LNALWTHFRRLVASVMLVAVTSLVLHGSAMAGLHQHGPGSTDCAVPSSGGHVHQAAAHDHSTPDAHQVGHGHGNGAAHHHAGADPLDAAVPDDQQQAADEGSPCCAGICAIALAGFGPDTASAPMGATLILVPVSQRGSGIDPNGLKRPPRPPCIA
jgi:hypothetical protein